jgi:hypothetical protein
MVAFWPGEDGIQRKTLLDLHPGWAALMDEENPRT